MLAARFEKDGGWVRVSGVGACRVTCRELETHHMSGLKAWGSSCQCARSRDTTCPHLGVWGRTVNTSTVLVVQCDDYYRICV